MNCEEANRSCLVDYLSALGYQPKKERGNDCWYLSPLREEKNPSFKVNKLKNVWCDYGTGDGRTSIDFGNRHHRCSVSELLAMLSSHSFHPQIACARNDRTKIFARGVDAMPHLACSTTLPPVPCLLSAVINRTDHQSQHSRMIKASCNLSIKRR